MSDETATGSAGATDGGGHSRRSDSEPTPLQSRANFLQNWDWLSVTQINGGLCERSRSERGINPEAHAAVAEDWQKQRAASLTLLEILQFLKSCHRRAPLLFYNGNTFAEIGRALANALFSDLSLHRRKEASSAVAHFITGVLDEQLMIQALESLSQTVVWKPGDRVKTLRGSLHGVVVEVFDDGRVVWRPEDTENELTAMADNLCLDVQRKANRP
ncbi:MAG: hypothetical protein ABSH48_04205 [Verrucomicrobiota bacterium]|jgi:hypothetical protein